MNPIDLARRPGLLLAAALALAAPGLAATPALAQNATCGTPSTPPCPPGGDPNQPRLNVPRTGATETGSGVDPGGVTSPRGRVGLSRGFDGAVRGGNPGSVAGNIDGSVNGSFQGPTAGTLLNTR